MGGYPLGYPDIRQDFRGKWTSASASASAGGYPLALADIRQRIADIRQRIADIRNGYPETSSTPKHTTKIAESHSQNAR
ncbi:hypothetical protein PGT21_032343 [Puccinia graminis f. sp. tritici]|uniref:Uncharacterized protein n=1 Tax=Puccinia graminis f. sp. tritici TaxID=56615 RepID=A0A5B0QK24_PUCGR|nr:hypothetical protein PGT21_032343 [Puccinia graminis f. sp. tritici]KAA1130792.1 hypothetical protein PGTUg99_019569 [Puccinia graminis f. sp. tritici]